MSASRKGMPKDLWILAVTAFVIANMYYDNKLIKMLTSWKKYYRMAGVAVFGLLLFLFCRRNPRESRALLENANDLVRLMPIDRNTSGLLQPVLRYTRQSPHRSQESRDQATFGYNASRLATQSPLYPISSSTSVSAASAASAPNGRVKRSVSETKKKYVAARQNWTCGECGAMLTAWFEVDHVKRLEHGGSNDASNLVALCRECHGKKTALENM